MSNNKALTDQLITALEHNAAAEHVRVDRVIPSGGNCMFHPLSLQILRVGIDISYTSVRRMIAEFLRDNPVFNLPFGTADTRKFYSEFKFRLVWLFGKDET